MCNLLRQLWPLGQWSTLPWEVVLILPHSHMYVNLHIEVSEVMSKNSICYGPCGSLVLLVRIFWLEDSSADANVYTRVFWLFRTKMTFYFYYLLIPTWFTFWCAKSPLYMYVNMPAPFQCFFDVVKSISVYSGKEGGGSII